MKKQMPKLKLGRETVVALDLHEKPVVGGYPHSAPFVCDPPTTSRTLIDPTAA